MVLEKPQPPVDPAKMYAEWYSMRDEYHALILSISPPLLNHRTIDTRWTVAEILSHMIQSIELIPQEVNAIRQNKDFLNLPGPMVGTINLILIKIRAKNATPQSLIARYDRAFETAILAWQSVRADEWTRGASLFGEGYRTLAENYALGVTHFREHAQQIRKSL